MRRMLKTRTTLRHISMLLALLTLLCAIPLQSAAWTVPSTSVFDNMKDVPAGWAYDGIKWVVSNEIMLNTGSNVRLFDPNAKVTRSMYTKICYNLIQGLERDTTLSGKPLAFTDVVPGAWYTESLTWAFENHVINGYSETAVGPNDQVTREQIARLMYNLITQYFGVDLSDEMVDLKIFKDYKKISGWATDAVSAMVAIGLYKGDSAGNFNPQGLATRAEIAVLTERLYRCYAESWPCYIDEELVPTMFDDFDGEGKQGWRHDVWTASRDGGRPAQSWQLEDEKRMYTEDGYLYMVGNYPEQYYDEDTTDETDDGINWNNCIAALYSEGLFSQAYGYYEMRMKPSQAAGFISTFWTTSEGHSGAFDPANSTQTNPFVEMDIFETLPHDVVNPGSRNEQRGKFFSTGHWNVVNNSIYQSEQWYIKGNQMKRSEEGTETPYAIPDKSFFDGQFHTVGFLWTEDGYTIYYDGNLVSDFKETPLSDAKSNLRVSCYYADDSWVDASRIWSQPEVYGMTEQEVRDSFASAFSASYIVDYVHVYQLKEYMNADK